MINQSHVIQSKMDESSDESLNSSDINYLEGPNDSLLDYGEEPDHNAHQCHTTDPTIMRGHKKCMKPYTKVRQFTALPFGDFERDGILTERMIEVCSCCLDQTVVPGKYALTTCVLERKGLKSIDILEYHQYIKYLDLSRNGLESVEVLGKLPFLQHLDVSHNNLSKLCEFQAPLCLKYLNYSWNLIEEMVDLAEFWSLVHLDLSHNLFEEIFGLNTLKYLNFLDISYNKIQRIENINALNIQLLYADFNNVVSFECTEDSLCKLLHISLSNNNLSKIEFLKNFRNIESVNLVSNDVRDLFQLTHLRNLVFLTNLNILGNPVVNKNKFRTVCLSNMERLEELNGAQVSPDEKGQVKFLKQTLPDLESYKVNYQNIPEIDSTVIPCYQNISSIIVFVGPIATKRHDLCKKLLELFPKYSINAVSHTTRPKAENEVDGYDYYFVSKDEFNKMLLNGKFLNCSHKYGFSYGLSYDEMKKTTEEIGILLVNGDIGSALQLKAKFLCCKLVLLLPKSEMSYKVRLHKKFASTPWLAEHLLILLKNREEYRISEAASVNPPHISQDASVSSPTPSKYDTTLSEKISPILKYQNKRDEPAKRVQSVGFTQHSFAVVESSPLSVSNTVLAEAPRLCTVSTVSTDVKDIWNENVSTAGSVIYGSSASKSIMVNNSMGLIASAASEENEKRHINSIGLTASTPSVEDGKRHTNSEASNVYDMTRGNSRKISIRQSGYILNANIADLYTSISQEFHCEDEYIMSVLLSKTDMEDDDSSSLGVSNDSNVSKRRDVSKTSMESIHEVLLEYFIQAQLMRRRKYLELYERYPGLFYSLINSDNLEEAVPKLTEVLKSCVLAQRKHINKSKVQCENVNICEEMIDEKINMLLDQIR